MRRQIVGLVVAAAYLLAAAGSLAADRLVPSEYPTIQAAIDAAVNGDSVIIAPAHIPATATAMLTSAVRQLLFEVSTPAAGTLLPQQ